MIEKHLSKIGFSPSEIKIYFYLLKTGPNYANKISTGTQINRTNVYEALDRLIFKGVVSFIVKNKVKWFEASSPDSLITLIDTKKDELEEDKKFISEELAKLKKLSNSSKNPLEINIFTGKKGLRTVFEEILENKKPISIIAAELQFKELFGPYFELWHKKRIKLKLNQKTIFSEGFRNKVKKRFLLDYKFIEDKFTNPTTTIIYGDYCLFIHWSKEPVGIKINNKEIVKSHQNYFNILWSQAKK